MLWFNRAVFAPSAAHWIVYVPAIETVVHFQALLLTIFVRVVIVELERALLQGLWCLVYVVSAFSLVFWVLWWESSNLRRLKHVGVLLLEGLFYISVGSLRKVSLMLSLGGHISCHYLGSGSNLSSGASKSMWTQIMLVAPGIRWLDVLQGRSIYWHISTSLRILSRLRVEVRGITWIRHPVFLRWRQLFCNLWQIRNSWVPSSDVCRDSQLLRLLRNLVKLIAPILDMHVLGELSQLLGTETHLQAFVVEPVVHWVADIVLATVVEVQRCVAAWTRFISFSRKRFTLCARLHRQSVTLSDGCPMIIPGHFTLINARIIIMGAACSRTTLVLYYFGSDLFLKLIETFRKLLGLMFYRLQFFLNTAEMHRPLIYCGFGNGDCQNFWTWGRLLCKSVFLSLLLSCLFFQYRQVRCSLAHQLLFVVIRVCSLKPSYQLVFLEIVATRLTIRFLYLRFSLFRRFGGSNDWFLWFSQRIFKLTVCKEFLPVEPSCFLGLQHILLGAFWIRISLRFQWSFPALAYLSRIGVIEAIFWCGHNGYVRNFLLSNEASLGCCFRLRPIFFLDLNQGASFFYRCSSRGYRLFMLWYFLGVQVLRILNIFNRMELIWRPEPCALRLIVWTKGPIEASVNKNINLWLPQLQWGLLFVFGRM